MFTFLFVLGTAAECSIRVDARGYVRVHIGRRRIFVDDTGIRWWAIGDGAYTFRSWGDLLAATKAILQRIVRRRIESVRDIDIPTIYDAPDPINLLRSMDDRKCVRYVPVGRGISRPSMVRFAGI